jgi:hypothetical protein
MRENPVRTGAAWVAAKSHFVFVVPEGLDGLAEELLSLPDPEWVGRYHYRGEEELTLRYLLALDALNFCFWPPSFPGKTSPSPLGEEGWGKGKWGVPGPDGERLTGYYALSFALCRIAQDFPEFFEAENLQKIEPEKLREFLGPIPLLSWRIAALREVGALLQRFGSAKNFFSQAKHSAQRLVEMLTSYLPMFRDAAVYSGRWVPFYKRAQILVADLWGTFEGQGLGEFRDLSWLTAFADYKLPQILWARRALRFHPRLAEKIRAGELIPRGGAEEVEIRALTVVAVEELRERLQRRGREILAFQVDWLLWNLAQERLSVPHHRTLTWAY